MFQLDNGKYIVIVGLLNNLNYLLDFLKQQQQNLNVKNDSIEKYSGLSYEFINKHPLLKTLIDWYLLIDEDDRICDDKHRLLKEFINAIIYNLTKPINHFRYSDSIKDFALSLYILGGKLTYEFVRLNLPGSLPNLTMLHSLISNSNLKISEAEFRFDELQNKFKNLNFQYAFGSEGMTSVIKKIKYDSITNTFVGFPTTLAHGIPIKEHYKTDSFDILKLWFSSIEKSSLLNVHMIQPLQSSSQNVIPSPFLLAAYGTNTTTTADDILQRWCPSTIQRYRVKQGLKAFHVISKPMKSAMNIEDRLWFCDYLQQWDEYDFMHLAPSDEFFVWAVRRPNYQNDRVWSFSLEDIQDDERYQELSAWPNCIGIYICFTAVKLMWVIKDDGASWDGAYYRRSILTENVIPFLSDPKNVLDPSEVVYLHDNASCHKANATQALLKDSGVDFFDRTQWPGNSPDLNVAEDVGSILMDKVESLMIEEHGANQNSKVVLLQHLQNVLHELENETELFENLLKSYPRRLKAVREANGGHTKY
ncbi:unnamed protein product [Rotaria sp. Silwood1]|nr:unnamed protein product [Rotaria sp. Silwood1]